MSFFLRREPVREAEGAGVGGGTEAPQSTEKEGEGSPQTPPKDGETTPAPAPAAPTPPQTDWRDRRIAALAAQRDELKGRAAELEAHLRQFQQQPAASPASVTPAPVEDALLTQRVKAEAAALVAQQQYNEKCNKVFKEGVERFADFAEKVAELKKVIDFSDAASVATYNTMLAMVIETDEPVALMHELGSDPNAAAALLALPPQKQAMELAKRAAKAAAPPPPPPVLPKPLRAVDGSGASAAAELDPNNPDHAGKMSTAQWIAARNKQVAARAAERTAARSRR